MKGGATDAPTRPSPSYVWVRAVDAWAFKQAEIVAPIATRRDEADEKSSTTSE